jgi:hypothetical protein
MGFKFQTVQRTTAGFGHGLYEGAKAPYTRDRLEF